MLSGLQRQMGECLPIYRILLLAFKKTQIGTGAFQTAAQILTLVGGQPMGWLHTAIDPLPNPLFGVFVHLHHSFIKFYAKIEKMCEKPLPFSVHLCYNEGKLRIGVDVYAENQ